MTSDEEGQVESRNEPRGASLRGPAIFWEVRRAHNWKEVLLGWTVQMLSLPLKGHVMGGSCKPWACLAFSGPNSCLKNEMIPFDLFLILCLLGISYLWTSENSSIWVENNIFSSVCFSLPHTKGAVRGVPSIPTRHREGPWAQREVRDECSLNKHLSRLHRCLPVCRCGLQIPSAIPNLP